MHYQRRAREVCSPPHMPELPCVESGDPPDAEGAIGESNSDSFHSAAEEYDGEAAVELRAMLRGVAEDVSAVADAQGASNDELRQSRAELSDVGRCVSDMQSQLSGSRTG